ncbi:hypothetical protein IE53DRAFT_364059 [Violaceomyces palustris]|uniref:Uncharacterized protein n=1 Tax=Violaceomyces palustris TaxID=1673888 RepID=A0ACD0NR44_9BASI|nr:hypothetical protein IE53DRAFT_364059 [Violaceomyces palustris]
MKYLSSLALALSATFLIANSAQVAASNDIMITSGGQGRHSTIRDIISGRKVRSHSHKRHSSKHNDTKEVQRSLSDQSEAEVLEDRANHKAHSTKKSSSNGYKLVKSYSGKTFFDDMYFFTGSDPTKGMVQYVSKSVAQNAGLIGTKNGNAYMAISPKGGSSHKSIRISTQDTFTGGIFVLNAVHMPTGCGVWPAFWSTPEDPSGGWPNGGEIDVIEGVHDFSRNMYSIHTTSGCRIVESALDMLGKLAMGSSSQATNCDAEATNDQGCAVQSQANGDYGVAFNNNGGGTHVLVWDSSDGISSYFFKKGSVPDDITSGNPDPSSWGKPKAMWPASKCNPDDYFWNHVAVFSNTLCGTWAGSSSVWSNAMSGQSQSCAKSTGASSCYEYISGSPDLSEAYWEIESLKIYQTSRRK